MSANTPHISSGVRPVVVGQLAVPGPAELPASPHPLLLARHGVVVGDVQHAGAAPVVVAAEEVVARARGHVRRRHRQVAVPRDVDPARVVHLVVAAARDRERRDVALAVVVHGLHVGREHRLVAVVDVHRRIRPEVEAARQRRRVREVDGDRQHGAAGAQGERQHPAQVPHRFGLSQPQRRAPVVVVDDAVIDRDRRCRGGGAAAS